MQGRFLEAIDSHVEKQLDYASRHILKTKKHERQMYKMNKV